MVQVTPSITLSNVTLSNNLLLNSYFKNHIIELYILYNLNVHVNFRSSQMLFTIQPINSFFYVLF